MNEFILGKIGEVLAFARHGNDTLEKGQEGFLKILDADEIEEMSNAFGELEKKLVSLAEEQDILDEVEEKADETLEKVNGMRDTYIEDNWDDETELLEWTGFFTGAALVHWHLIAGAAGSLEFEELKKVSKDAIEFHSNLFISDEETLQDIGATFV